MDALKEIFTLIPLKYYKKDKIKVGQLSRKNTPICKAFVYTFQIRLERYFVMANIESNEVDDIVKYLSIESVL